MDVVRASRLGLRRKRMNRKRSKRLFSRTANRARPENVTMRLGTRL